MECGVSNPCVYAKGGRSMLQFLRASGSDMHGRRDMYVHVYVRTVEATHGEVRM